jgi:hypothetical protein
MMRFYTVRKIEDGSDAIFEGEEPIRFDDLVETLNDYFEFVRINPASTIDRYRKALQSISKNSCCGNCQEAKLVALEALRPCRNKKPLESDETSGG